jgi:hypothetical protein
MTASKAKFFENKIEEAQKPQGTERRCEKNKSALKNLLSDQN